MLEVPLYLSLTLADAASESHWPFYSHPQKPLGMQRVTPSTMQLQLQQVPSRADRSDMLAVTLVSLASSLPLGTAAFHLLWLSARNHMCTVCTMNVRQCWPAWQRPGRAVRQHEANLELEIRHDSI